MVLLWAAMAWGGVFVDGDRAQQLVDEGAVVIDARASARWRRSTVDGAGSLSWWRLRDGRFRDGHLSADLGELRDALEVAGVRGDVPVLVVGAGAQGWGEEGRIFWTLEYLGHPEVYVLDGGIDAWTGARARGRQPGGGTMEPAPEEALRVRTVELAEGWAGVVWDTRTVDEFEGATPAGEQRGGHIPGAVNLFYRELTDAHGQLLPDALLRERLTDAGVSFEAPVVTLCSGGVRAGFGYTVLRHLDHPDVAVYDGSMWAWSADPTLPMEAP